MERVSVLVLLPAVGRNVYCVVKLVLDSTLLMLSKYKKPTLADHPLKPCSSEPAVREIKREQAGAVFKYICSTHILANI